MHPINDPSGTRRASAEPLSRLLLPPPLALRPVESCPVGGGPRARDRALKRRSCRTRAVAVVRPLRVAALPHVGSRRVSPTGTPLRPAGCRARLNRRTNAAFACALRGAAGRRSRSRWSACGSAPFASAPDACPPPSPQLWRARSYRSSGRLCRIQFRVTVVLRGFGCVRPSHQGRYK